MTAPRSATGRCVAQISAASDAVRRLCTLAAVRVAGPISIVINTILVPSPIVNVPAHVVQAPGVRSLLSYRMRRTVRIPTVPADLVQIGVVAMGIGYRPAIAIAGMERRVFTPGPDRVLPLRLRRQTIPLAILRLVIACVKRYGITGVRAAAAIEIIRCTATAYRFTASTQNIALS